MPLPNNFSKMVRDKDNLSVIMLNVGDGDAIIVKFPKVGEKNVYAVVDCYNAKKTIAVFESLETIVPGEKPDFHIEFICATHPHSDHIAGMGKLIKWCIEKDVDIHQFWDSGFRHISITQYKLIQLLRESKIKIAYPTSGYETTINKVAVRVLNPSIRLKNRYDTYGTNINNASIVIKLEYPPKDIAIYSLPKDKMSNKELAEEDKRKQNTVILGGDAQFDAWAVMSEEFPTLRSTKNRGQMIDPTIRKHQPLKCEVLKVPHHMSKHGISLEVLETLRPIFTVASCSDHSEHGFPHELTVKAAEDIYRGKKDKILYTGHHDPTKRSGTVVAILNGKTKLRKIYPLGEAKSKNAPL